MSTLSPADVLAPLWFLACWVGYGLYADREGGRPGSLMARMHAYRVVWMRRMLERDNRMLDSQIIGTLAGSVSFFASTTIFIVAGLIAVFGARDQVLRLVGELPFAADTPPVLWDLKLLLLLVLFVFAFFKFTWAVRHFNYCAIMLGAAPVQVASDGEAARFAERTARMASSAANHFNSGLRAYYFGLAALSWFVHPWLFIAATTWVVVVVYRREFRSRLLRTLSAIDEPASHLG
jgi:uncharacterized membrane protein